MGPFVSASCGGERCRCGKPAVKKVGEEIPFDDPTPNRHNLTAYVCAEHYAELMGPLARAMTRTVSPSPEQLSELASGLREFADTLRVDRHYMTAQTCREREVQIRQAADALESAQAEIAHLTTVSGDMVEEMARAIYARRPFVLASTATTFGHQVARTCDWDGAPAYYQQDMLDLAQAAATIAKGRMERLEAALQKIADDDYDPVGPLDSFTEAAADIARAALKDKPGQ